MADWEDFGTESSSDPSDVKLHAASDTDSGIVPIVGVSHDKGRADSFSSAADEGAKKGRLNKWYLLLHDLWSRAPHRFHHYDHSDAFCLWNNEGLD